MRGFIVATVGCGVLALSAGPAGAADQELLKVLLENNTITAEQYQRLREPTPGEANNGGVQHDVGPSLVLGGRLMVDTAFYRADKYGLGDGTELRRARIDVESGLGGGFSCELGVDVADGTAAVKDAVVRHRFSGPLLASVGQFKEPFSLEELTSSKYLTFMERGLPNALAPGRAIGLGLQGWGSRWTAAAGLFGQAYDDEASQDSEDEGWGGSGRLTILPWRCDRQLLHLGVAVSYRQPADQETLAFAARPESHLTGIKYVNTGELVGVEEYWRGGGELALLLGSWSLQGEYIHTTVHFVGGQPSVSFGGWYLFGSWLLTGESRTYKAKSATFGRLHLKRRGGAVELALRASRLDLTDGPVSGGTEKNYTVGLNWYVTDQVRLLTNYILVDTDEDADDNTTLPGGDDDPAIFQLRLQVDF